MSVIHKTWSKGFLSNVIIFGCLIQKIWGNSKKIPLNCGKPALFWIFFSVARLNFIIWMKKVFWKIFVVDYSHELNTFFHMCTAKINSTWNWWNSSNNFRRGTRLIIRAKICEILFLVIFPLCHPLSYYFFHLMDICNTFLCL